MRFVDKEDVKTLKILEKDVTNKFCSHWFQKVDYNGDKIEQWCKKIDVPGECYCKWCNFVIKYGSGGLKCLISHSKSTEHFQAAKSVDETVILSSYGAENDEEKRRVDLNSRKIRVESTICAFLAENSLPFTAGPKLLDLAKTLAKDSKALQSTSMCRTTAAYKMKFGLAKTIKEKLIEALRKNAFSLNIDESTSRAHKSILTVLVQYFSTERKRVVVQHFSSIELSVCTSNNIFEEIISLIEGNQIPWENLISVLFDSCNTMRGVKSGVESLIRKKKASHLLSIGGDTCHTVNNSAKKFAEIFEKKLENLCDILHFDLQSVHQRSIFFSICEILDVKKLVPISRPDHRWIYVLPAIERILLLWDALLIHYFSWVKYSDRDVYDNQLQEIYKKRNVKRSAVKKIEKYQAILKSKNLTTAGKERKENIIDKLFIHQKQTLLEANAYNDIFPIFSKYIKLFQSQKPLIHELHVEMFTLIKSFMSFFINHTLISNIESCKDLKKININDENNHLSDNVIYVGAGAKKLISKCKANDYKVCSFKSTLKKAYVKCTQYMIEKLPYDNPALIAFSCLNPQLRGQLTTFTGFLKMSDLITSVLTLDEKNELDKEIRDYQIDEKIIESMSHNLFVDDKMNATKTLKNIDEYWSEIFEMSSLSGEKKYSILGKIVKAALSCFHGPVVEGAFSLMESTITNHRTSLDVEGLDSYQTIKYYLKAEDMSSLEAFYSTESPETHPVEKRLLSNMMKSKKEYNAHLKKKSGESKNDENLTLGSASFNKFQIPKLIDSKNDEKMSPQKANDATSFSQSLKRSGTSNSATSTKKPKIVNQNSSLQSSLGRESSNVSTKRIHLKEKAKKNKQTALTSFFKRN